MIFRAIRRICRILLFFLRDWKKLLTILIFWLKIIKFPYFCLLRMFREEIWFFIIIFIKKFCSEMYAILLKNLKILCLKVFYFKVVAKNLLMAFLLKVFLYIRSIIRFFPKFCWIFISSIVLSKLFNF
jgi:hypothetical protein